MERIFDILSIVLPVFIALGIGMLCRIRRILTPEGVATLKKVAVTITLPAVSLAAFSEADYSGGRGLVPIWIFSMCCIALGLGYLARRLLRIDCKLTPYLCTAFEGGMLGFSLYPLIYGELSPFAIVVLGQTLFIFTLYKLLLAGAKGKKAILHEAITSPSLWAIIIGLILGTTGIYRSMSSIGVQKLFDATLDFIAKPTSFMILLTVGYDLRPDEIRWGVTAKLIAARLSIMALMLILTLIVNKLLLGSVIPLQAAIMLFILPPPFVLPAFSHEESEAGILSSTLSVMTLITILGFSIMAAVAG